MSDIYVLSCVEFQLKGNPQLFCFETADFRTVQKNLRLDCHLSTYLVLKLYYIHTRDCSQFQCKFKTRKSRGLPLSCSTSTQQLGTQMSVWCQNYEVPEKMDT